METGDGTKEGVDKVQIGGRGCRACGQVLGSRWEPENAPLCRVDSRRQGHLWRGPESSGALGL